MKSDNNYYAENGLTSAREQTAIMEAIHRIQAIIEFANDGTILHANQLFLDTMGYKLHEVVGKHHRMFCDPVYAQGEAYQAFWQRMHRFRGFNRSPHAVLLQILDQSTRSGGMGV